MVAEHSITTIEGIVSKTNGNGFRLVGREGWLNFSKFAIPAPAMPAEGQRVAVGIDKSGFVREVEIAGDSAGMSTVVTSAARDDAADVQWFASLPPLVQHAIMITYEAWEAAKADPATYQWLREHMADTARVD
jgi:hypothetical protein